MSEGVEFDVSLKDDVSGPAKAAASSASSLEKALGGLEGAASGAGLADVSKALGGVSAPAGDASAALGGVEAELGPLTGGLSVVAGAALAAGAALGALVLGGAKLALQAGDFKESTLISLRTLTGTEEAAQATYSQIDSIAKTIGGSQQDIATKATALLNAGVKSGAQLEETLKASYALAAVDPAGAAKLDGIIKKSAAAGSFQLTKKALAGTGVGFKDIAKQLGITEQQLQSQIKQGTISASAGLDALNKTINAKLGDIAHQKALGTLDGQLGILKATATSIFSNVNTKPFVDGLGKIVALVDDATPSGKALKAALVGGFDALFKVASATLPVIKAGLLELGIAGLKVYISIKPAVDHFRKLFESGDNKTAIDAVKLLADGVGLVAGQVADVVVAVAYMAEGTINSFRAAGAAVDDVEAEFKSLYDDISSLFGGDSSQSLGASLVDGIVAGIKSGISHVGGAAKEVADSAYDTIKETLGIASPSKVMAELGGHTADGFAKGVGDSAPAANDAMADLAKPPQLGASSGTASGDGGGGGGGAVVDVGGVQITIDGAGKNAHEIAEIVMSELTSRLEQLAIGAGR